MTPGTVARRFAAILGALALLTGPVHVAGATQSAPATPVVRLPFPHDDGSLTPYSFELGYPLMTLVYDTLLWRDDSGVPRPWLAESLEITAGGRTVTLRLAPGARWHDGVPLTAADVAFTFDFVASHPHPRFTPELRAVRRVEARDASTVAISLREPAPGFVDQPLADLPILPAHIWSRLAPDDTAPPGLPVGSGPYRLVEHRPGQGYRFEANADYFRGPPAVGALEVPVITSAEETVRALRARRVDMIPVSLPEDEAARVRGLGTRLLEGPSYLGTVLVFNLRQPPFDRVEVRRAVAKALDLGRVARAAGDAVPADRGYLHPVSTWAPEQALHVFDQQAARAELAELDLPAIEVLTPDNDPVKLEAGRQVALALQRVGIEATSKSVSRDGLSRAVGEDGSPPSFQAAIRVGFPLASYDPDFLGRVFGSRPDEAPFNDAGYTSAVFDDIARQIATTVDPSARRSVVGEALQLLAADAPVVPLFFATGSYTFRPAVYDGWVFVKGSGILDKRSFERRVGAMPEPAPQPVPAGSDPAGNGAEWSPLRFVALGLSGFALVMIVAGLLRRRR